jgi:hypothetical protein
VEDGRSDCCSNPVRTSGPFRKETSILKSLKAMQLLQILQEWPGALPFVIVAAHIEHELEAGILVDSVEFNSDRKLRSCCKNMQP